MAQRSFDKVKSLRIATLILIDILLINLSVLSCLLLRFEFSFSSLSDSTFVDQYLIISIPYTLVTLVIFACLHLYRSLWEYASIDELRNIIIAVILSNIIGYAVEDTVTAFADQDSMPAWSAEALTSLRALGILTAPDGNANARDTMDRATTAAWLARSIQLMGG